MRGQYSRAWAIEYFMSETKTTTKLGMPIRAAGESCGAPDPICVIEEEHALQLELCNILEFLADSHPDAFDHRLAGLAITILRSGLPQHMELEEDVFFPLLRWRIGGTRHLAAILDRLTDEHEIDRGLAVEIADKLEALCDGRSRYDSEALVYMLQGFLEGQRRHIAWENGVILPLARQFLLPVDLAAFQAHIMTTNRPICTRQSLTRIRRAGQSRELCRTCDAGPRTNNLFRD